MPQVVVIEHDSACLQRIRDALEAQYHVVVLAAGEAMESISSETAAVLVASRLMSLDGLVFARLLQHRLGEATPPLLLLHEGEAGVVASALQSGFSDCLAKPFDLEELQARLSCIVRRHADGRLMRRLKDLAERDPLTGLWNRRGFHDHAVGEICKAARHKIPVSLLVVDVDDFKRINDTFGHATGDAVLVAISQAMTKVLRRYDLLARVGGDEFVVLLSGVGEKQAALVADKLSKSVVGIEPEVSVSIGMASQQDHDDRATKPENVVQGLFAEADRGLYRAKVRRHNIMIGVST